DQAAGNAAAAQSDADQAKADAATAQADADKANSEADQARASAAKTAGAALASAKAALAARDSASKIAAEADKAIQFGAPYQETDAAAGLAVLVAQDSKKLGQQQDDAAQAAAGEAAKAAAAAQALADQATADAKVAQQAAAQAAQDAVAAQQSANAARQSAEAAATDATAAVSAANAAGAQSAAAVSDAAATDADARSAAADAAATDAAATAAEHDAAGAHQSADAATAVAADAQNDAVYAAQQADSAQSAVAGAADAADQAEKTAEAAEADERAREAAARASAQQNAAGMALSPSDASLLLASCGQTCVDQYNADVSLVGTDLGTFIKNQGGDIILDFIGVTDLEKCFNDGNVSGCLWTVVNAVCLAFPVLKLFEMPEFVAKAAEISPKIVKFIEDLRKAKKELQKFRDLLETLKRAKEAEDLSDRLDQVCGGRVQPGQIDYGPAGPGGRATIGVACLTPEDLTKGSPTSNASRYATAGYDAGRNRAVLEGEAPELTINACHLIGDQIGGSGVETRNLVTCSRAANAFSIAGVKVLNPNMLTYESQIKAAVGTRGQTVAYVAFPEYEGNNVIPYAIKMSAKCVANCTNNPINISDTIQNELWSRAKNAWVNISR
ncbi:MAG: hypothetical protein HOV87_15225, partial [Catenulispora sp.]|nr:hypothetical protein [Catenulispora sp.]